MERDERGRFPIKPKHCPSCNRDLPITKFSKDVQTKDGRRIYCKECNGRERRIYIQRKRAISIEDYRMNQAIIQKKFRKSPRGRFWTLKYNARRKAVPFEISIEEFVQWYGNQPKVCSYCGLPFRGAYHQDPLAETIDRKDNSVGYILGNIILTCRRCNTIKGNWFTYNEMLEIADQYLRNRYGGVISESI